jgi:hypothetical protein
VCHGCGGARHQVELDRVSFKGTVDALRQYSDALGRARSRKRRRQLWDDLLLNLARDLVPLRPGRLEPRTVKRRPKGYPLLNRPRQFMRELPHRSKHRKKSANVFKHHSGLTPLQTIVLTLVALSR